MPEPMRAADTPPRPMLSVRGLNAWYGESHVLHGVDFDIARGEVVTLLGRNGAGKTTTLKSIMGIVPRREGSVVFEGHETIRMPSNRIARRGIAWCPEERAIFASLDVEENLLLPPVVGEGGLPVAQILDMFPNLRERLHSPGTKLSGGEQQMLAIGRILRTGRAPAACSTSRPRGWRRSSSSRSGVPSGSSSAAGSRSCWSSRISGSRRPSRTGTT
jgi:branched-chain amino acid transport system ATP-binding protein